MNGRRWRLAAAAAVCAAAIAAVGTFALVGSAEETPGLTPEFSGRPALPVINDAVVERIAADPQLSRAPWLFTANGQHLIGAVEPLPSLEFPPGVTYEQALTQLFRSVAEQGRLPASATIAEPLPASVIVVDSGDRAKGLRLSLTAPFGYDPDSSRILSASTSTKLPLPEASKGIEEAAARGVALPSFLKVSVPVLSGCQLVTGDQIPEVCR